MQFDLIRTSAHRTFNTRARSERPRGDSANPFPAKELQPFTAARGGIGGPAHCGKRQTKCGMADDPAEAMGCPGEVTEPLFA